MGCAPLCGLLECIRLGTLCVAAHAFNYAKLLAARLRMDEHDVSSGFGGCGRLARRDDTADENGR